MVNFEAGGRLAQLHGAASVFSSGEVSVACLLKGKVQKSERYLDSSFASFVGLLLVDVASLKVEFAEVAKFQSFCCGHLR